MNKSQSFKRVHTDFIIRTKVFCFWQVSANKTTFIEVYLRDPWYFLWIVHYCSTWWWFYGRNIATVHFPCGFRCVTSLLLSKREGLDHRTIYVGGPWKIHDRLRLAGPLTHAQFGGSIFKFVCLLQNWCVIFGFIHSNKQMEIKTSRYGWPRHFEKTHIIYLYKTNFN